MNTTARCRNLSVRSGLSTLALALGLALLATPALAQTAPTNLKERFQAIDKNGDGRVDREEFHLMVVERFYFRDKNRDGYLVVQELTEASPNAFRDANSKADGRLTLDEYVNALFKDFAAADTNGDGVLVYEEIEIYVRTNRR